MEKDAVVDAFRDYLDNEGYHYKYDTERGYIVSNFSLKSKLKNARLILDFKDHGVVAYAFSPVSGDKDAPLEILKYLTLANYALLNGNFEFDLRDGEIRYKVWTPTEGLESLSKQIIEDAVNLPLSMLDRYGNGIAALAMGFSDADTEYQKVQEE